MLAATGMRANEALSILTKHMDFEDATVFIRGEFTKTKTDRTVFLTKECVKQLELWKEYRERERRIVNRSHEVNYVTKRLEPNELFFTTGRHDNVTDPAYLYHSLADEFGKVLDRIGLSDRHDNKGNRHTITLHSFRRFVKTTISDLGYQDFSEYFIGHSQSTYWRKPEAEKVQLFHKIEPYLTYLDYSELEAKGADVETKLQEKESRIEVLEEKLTELSKKLYEAGILKKD
jgi:integrase